MKLKSLAVTETTFEDYILLLQKILAHFLEFSEVPRVKIYKMKKIIFINTYKEKISQEYSSVQTRAYPGNEGAFLANICCEDKKK